MILVIGRPALGESGELQGTTALVALAGAEAGGRVELIGSVGDDPAGDEVALALGRAGIGHAALLRDPAGATPRGQLPAAGPAPRLDVRDVELGLAYLVECRVLVLAEWLGDDVMQAARRAAAYHDADLIVLLDNAAVEPARVGSETTILRAPEEGSAAFGHLVGRYAAGLAAGEGAESAWRAALTASGWSEAGQGSDVADGADFADGGDLADGGNAAGGAPGRPGNAAP